jgi:hypothetical protein
MKLLSLLTLLVIPFFLQAQSPFNYGKSRDIYFLSQRDISQFAIKHIYTVTADPEYGSWELFDIRFTDSTSFQNNWCTAVDVSTRIPSLDSVIQDSKEGYINGHFYSFVNGRIDAAGMGGKGALCHWVYSFRKNYAIATEECRYPEGSRKRKVVYFSDGRVNYKTCCRTTDSEEKIVGKSHVDTTYYVYDKGGRIVGYKKQKLQKTVTPIFSELVAKHERTYNQSYINKTVFEDYVRQQIGYHPKIVLFEIYRHAAVVFKFDEKQKKYIEMEDVHL